MRRRIPLSELTVGMQVVGLDRSWLETPFFLHRMRITSVAQIEALKACGVRYVVISVDKEEGPAPTPSVEQERPTDGQAPVIGTFLDISVLGCRVAVPDEETAFVPRMTVRLEFELPGIGHIANLDGTIRNISEQAGKRVFGVEFQFHHREYIEFRGWGGTVRKAIEQFVAQRHPQPVP